MPMSNTAKQKQKIETALMRLSIPHHMREGIVAYALDGRESGGFLTSIFENDFLRAWSRADGINRQRLASYAELVACDMPDGACGSPKIVKQWIESHASERAAKQRGEGK